MTEHPILFSREMVRAILEGRKTQTRRVVKPQPTLDFHYMSWLTSDTYEWTTGHPLNVKYPETQRHAVKCPYGKVGDRLWVRETWATSPFLNMRAPRDLSKRALIVYRADEINESHFCFRPSIHMPRWASRLNLEIVDVRVERVQDISEHDACAEGINFFGSDDSIMEGSYLYSANPLPVKTEQDMRFGWGHTAGEAFHQLWDSINTKRGFGWDKNPWTWVVEFKKV